MCRCDSGYHADTLTCVADTAQCTDSDQDTYGSNCTNGPDCDDNNNQVFQILNAYIDLDGDGYGIGSNSSICTGVVLPAGYADNDLDCDDNDNSRWDNCPQPNQNPIASFSINASGGTAPLTVRFDASGSSDSEGNIVSYTWNFGDGNIATGIIVSHTFIQDGSYTVSLTVANDLLATDAAIRTVLVGSGFGRISALPYVMPISSGALTDLTPGGWKGMEDPATGRLQSRTEFVPGGGIPGVGNGDAYRAILPKGPSYLIDPINADNQGSAGFGPFELINPTDNVYIGYVIRFNAGIRNSNASRNGSLGVKLLEIQASPDPMECRAFTYLRVIETDLGFRPAEDGGTPHAPSLDSTLRIIGDGSPNDIAGEWIYIVHRLNTTTNVHGYSVYRRSGFVEEYHYDDYPFQCAFTKSNILYAGIGNTWESAINTLSDADASYDLAYVHAWSNEAPDIYPPEGFHN